MNLKMSDISWRQLNLKVIANDDSMIELGERVFDENEQCFVKNLKVLVTQDSAIEMIDLILHLEGSCDDDCQYCGKKKEEINKEINDSITKVMFTSNESLKYGKQDSDLIKNGGNMIEGVCCALCYGNGSGCPVQSANNWSKHKNFCSEFNSQYGNLEQTLKHLWGINSKSEIN